MSTKEQTIEALVIGGRDHGDGHRVVELLTRQGKRSVIAFGAKHSKRRFLGTLIPFTSIDASLAPPRPGRSDMVALSSAVVTRGRLSITRSLESLALASYVCELGARVSPEGEGSEAVFRRVERVLDRLCDSEDNTALRRAFELGLLVDLGYTPELEACVACGRSAAPAFVDFARGGLLCAAHRSWAEEIGPKTLEWARRVLGAADEAFDPLGGLEPAWAHRAAAKMSGPLLHFYGGLLDRPLKAARMLEELGCS